jgi:hypothetical protein
MLSMGKKSWNCKKLYGPLSRWQLCTAEDTRRERQLSRETGRPIRKPNKQLLIEAKGAAPLSEGDPLFTPQEQAWLETEGISFLLGGWWKFVNDCITIPESLAPAFVKQFHEGTHSGQ